METLATYLEGLFINVPQTPDIQRLKKDLLANLEDRYEELKSQGKSEGEAVFEAISEIGSVEELLAELDLAEEVPEAFPEDSIQLADFFDYEKRQRKNTLYLALGSLFLLVGVGGLFFIFHQTSGISMMIATVFTILLIPVAVACYIVGGMGMARLNREFDDRLIAPKVAEAAKFQQEKFNRSFVLSLVVGIGIILFSTLFLIYVGVTRDYFVLTAVGLWFVGTGFGVFFLTYGGVIFSMYSRFIKLPVFVAESEKPGVNARKAQGKSEEVNLFFSKVFWPVAVLLYFIWSFVFNAWGISWLIFPLGGLLQSAVDGYVSYKKNVEK